MDTTDHNVSQKFVYWTLGAVVFAMIFCEPLRMVATYLTGVQFTFNETWFAAVMTLGGGIVGALMKGFVDGREQVDKKVQAIQAQATLAQAAPLTTTTTTTVEAPSA